MRHKHEKDEPMTFILFPNPKKTEFGNQPDLVGKVILEDGTVMRLAGWEKEMTKVKGKYIGGKMNPFLTKEQVAERDAAIEAKKKEDDDVDDLPF